MPGGSMAYWRLAKAMTPMTVAMMMFTALSLIESASMPASLSKDCATRFQRPTRMGRISAVDVF